MLMRFKLQLVVMADDDEVCIDDLVVLDKQHDRLEHIGLSLAEAKTLLLELQRQVVSRQIAAFLSTRAACPCCGRPRGVKDHKTVVFRTLFGNLELASPRLRRCPCQHDGQLSTSPLVDLLPEHTAPELVYLESKWSSLVSYGLTVEALRDFLPMDAKLSATSVRRNTLRVARRCESDLHTQEEAVSPPPRSGHDVPGVVGIDGGYLRHWAHKHTHFVAIVGKSVPTGGEAKCFGFVQSQDTWPRRRLTATLRAQGLRSGPKLAFLSDGEDSIRSLQWHLSPRAQHLLDWFHLAMRLQRLRQFLVGLTHLDTAVGMQMQAALERTKWSLWHGKPKQAFHRFREVEWRIWQFGTRYPKFSALARAVNEFQRYIDQNAHIIPDYGARWRAGQVISTAFIESLVNSLLAKRFAKKQSMQWTPQGAHLLLQIRTRTLNGDLASTFRKSYPDFSVADPPAHRHLLAA
jgi:hypothetical protein